MNTLGLEIEKRVNPYEDKFQRALYDLYEKSDFTNLLISIENVNQWRRRQVKGLYYRYTGTKASRFEWDNPVDADGVPIFARTSSDAMKVNIKNHTPFDQKIVTNKASYIAGEPVKVDEALQAALGKTDFDSLLYELTQAATRGGNSFLLVQKDSNDITFKKINEWECVSVYHPETGELVFTIRYYNEVNTSTSGMIQYNETETIYELYESEVVRTFKGRTGSNSYTPGETIPHGFDGVPLIEFANNTERTGDVELTLSLQDAFDVTDSDLTSEIAQLRLAYLLMVDQGLVIDDDLIKDMKKTGIIALEQGSAQFIEKNINAEAVENLKKDLERRIYAFSNSYNPDELGAEAQMTAYQIRQKLFGLDNSSNETIAMFKKSLSYLFGLLIGGVYDGDINFMKSVPRNALEDVKMATEAGFRFSQNTMAQFIPLSFNQNENAKEVEEEQGQLLERFTLPGEDMDDNRNDPTEDTTA